MGPATSGSSSRTGRPTAYFVNPAPRPHDLKRNFVIMGRTTRRVAKRCIPTGIASVDHTKVYVAGLEGGVPTLGALRGAAADRPGVGVRKRAFPANATTDYTTRTPPRSSSCEDTRTGRTSPHQAVVAPSSREGERRHPLDYLEYWLAIYRTPR